MVKMLLSRAILVVLMLALGSSLDAAAGEQSAPAQSQPATTSASTSERPLHIGGYGSFRIETNNVPGNQFVPGGSASGFTFRRFVLTTDARLSDRLRVYSETEFERLLEIEVKKKAEPQAGGVKFSQGVEGNNHGEISIEQFWLQYELGRNQAIRAGIVLPPLGRFNILHDDDYWDLPRRTLIDRDAPVLPVKSAWREAGAGLVGSIELGASSKLSYQAYVLSGSTLNFNLENIAQTRSPRRSKQELEAEVSMASGAVDGTQNANAFSWRAALSPTLAGEIALSGYHGRYTPTFLRGSEPVNSLGLDGKWRFGRFEVEGEGIYTAFKNVRGVAASFAEAVAHSSVETSSRETALLENEIEIEMRGLSRSRYGFWTDFKYHWRPAFLKSSFLGRGFEDPQIIPILRYERVWLDQDLSELAFSGGRITALETANFQQGRLSAGINYRPIQRVGIQLTYEHNHRHEGTDLIFPRLSLKSTNGFVAGLTFGF